MLAPVLFKVALLLLAWQLSTIPDTFLLVYGDEVTVWSRHMDIDHHQVRLKTALDKTSH